MAARDGRLEAATLLVSRGADLDVETESGRTALQAAVLDGDRPMTELLIAAGADTGFIDDDQMRDKAVQRFGYLMA